MLQIRFDNTYARELEGFYVACNPAAAPAPRRVFVNELLAARLGLDPDILNGPQGLAFLSGNALPEGAQPIAQAYAGHQFGGFSPQLGDGRALLIGELLAPEGRRWDLAFKGSGRTPFSRGGDGKAALGPMLREALISEAMAALGIPTTRALAVVATGTSVLREQVLPGAVLTRVAASHLRVGTFEFYAARGEHGRVRQLCDYAMARHPVDTQSAESPSMARQGAEPADSEQRPLGLLRTVIARQAALVAQWMNVGFIHGVMNTDNMTISGETIDYGPCAFLEGYDPGTVFSSIDQGGRYAYANQPGIAQWNLARFAETLLPLIARSSAEADMQQAVSHAMEVLGEFPKLYETALRKGQLAKLGLEAGIGLQSDPALIDDWLALLQAQAVDFTLAWRHLADAAAGDESALRGLFRDLAPLLAWLSRWQRACQREAAAGGPGEEARAARMRQVNPWIIPRNQRVEEALRAAGEGNLQPFEQLLALLRRPFDPAPGATHYTAPAPIAFTATYQTFCGT